MKNFSTKDDIDLINEMYEGGPRDVPDSIRDAVGEAFEAGDKQQAETFVDNLTEGKPSRDMVIALIKNYEGDKSEESIKQWLDKFVYIATNVIEDGDWWEDREFERTGRFPDDEE